IETKELLTAKPPLRINRPPCGTLTSVSPAIMRLALISCVAALRLIWPALWGLAMINAPPEPAAMVYLLALSKLILPTVRSPSKVTVRGAVIAPRKLANATEELGTPPSQFAESAQLPSPSLIHCGAGPSSVRVATIVPERRKELSLLCSVLKVVVKRTGRVRVSMLLAATTDGVPVDALKIVRPVKSLLV